MSQNLLILGSNGFFGKAILEHLYLNKSFYKKKFKTITVSSRRTNKIKKVLKKLKNYFNIIYLKEDIFKIKKLPNTQYIIYCILLKNIKNDFKAVQHFSKLLKKLKNKTHIIFTSSGAVYGEKLNQNKKVKENINVSKRFNFPDLKKRKYAYYKLKSENILEKLSKKGFRLSILRCFAFVGEDLPRNKRFVIGNFINKVLALKKLIVKSENEVVRSYMYQDDLANWILTILLKSKKKFDIYNVGSDDPISIHRLAEILSKKYKIKFISNLNPSKVTDHYLPNIDKAKKAFSLKLRYNSLQAIFKTINKIKR